MYSLKYKVTTSTCDSEGKLKLCTPDDAGLL